MGLKIVLYVVIGLITIGLAFMLGNKIVVKKCISYVKRFPSVVPIHKATLQVEPNGNYFFRSNEDFTVLQLTDLHIGGGILSYKKDKLALRAVASMITEQKPNLVVITGDIAFPLVHYSGTGNNKSAHKIVAEMMEALQMYWVPVFGNHDTEIYSKFNREKIGDFYESDSYPHCLFKKGERNLDGCGNSLIPIKNDADIIVQSLVFLDSHAYTDDNKFGLYRKYDCIKENQVKWYKNEMENAIQHNQNIVTNMDTEHKTKLQNKYCKGNSLVFFHIPIQEYQDAYEDYLNKSPDATLFYGQYGEKNHAVHHPVQHDALFETASLLKGHIGFFCGHDHLNNASILYKDIRLTFGYSIDYLVYFRIHKYGLYRGCTNITIKTDSEFNVEGLNYYASQFKVIDGRKKEKVTMEPYFKENT